MELTEFLLRHHNKLMSELRNTIRLPLDGRDGCYFNFNFNFSISLFSSCLLKFSGFLGISLKSLLQCLQTIASGLIASAQKRTLASILI